MKYKVTLIIDVDETNFDKIKQNVQNYIYNTYINDDEYFIESIINEDGVGEKVFECEKDLIDYLRKEGDEVYNDATDDYILQEAFDLGWCYHDDDNNIVLYGALCEFWDKNTWKFLTKIRKERTYNVNN
tara:strand:- start:185 stop:571 length:387 start_codon:yes stop_codon:yes gene_type:complete